MQQCRELSDTGRNEVIQHAFDGIARDAAAMRRDTSAPLLDVAGNVLKARLGKLARTRALEVAREAGRKGAEEARGQGDANKRKGDAPAAGTPLLRHRTSPARAQHRASPSLVPYGAV